MHWQWHAASLSLLSRGGETERCRGGSGLARYVVLMTQKRREVEAKALRHREGKAHESDLDPRDVPLRLPPSGHFFL
jgi:hypothetical protein